MKKPNNHKIKYSLHTDAEQHTICHIHIRSTKHEININSTEKSHLTTFSSFITFIATHKMLFNRKIILKIFCCCCKKAHRGIILSALGIQWNCIFLSLLPLIKTIFVFSFEISNSPIYSNLFILSSYRP